MRVEWFNHDSAFEALKPEWNHLLSHSVSDTLFLTWEWQTTWWKHLGSGQLCIITMREDDGTLIGVAPLFCDPAPDGLAVQRQSFVPTLSLVGCVDVSDYLDVIVAQGHTEQVYSALLDTLGRSDFTSWREVQLCTLPAASPTNSMLKALAEARGYDVEWRLHDVSPRIELPATFDDYLASLDKKQRHEIRRKLRRVEEAGARWYAVQGLADLDKAVVDYIELHKKSQPDKHQFMDDRMQAFFAEMARVLQQQGWLQLEFLDVNGERAAAVFNFLYANQVLVYNSGYDPDQYGALSPGVALFALSIREAIQAKRSVYDFLRGDEEYKYRFGASNTHVYELHIRKK